MNWKTLDIRTDERGVAQVRLNTPEKRNVLSARMIAELTEMAGTIGNDSRTRAIVLSGAGSTFCAGADLTWMKAQIEADRAQRMREARKLAEMLQAMNTIRAPLIGRLQGGAFGGGIGMACVCDVTLADTTTKFCFSETRLGIIPATIGPYVVHDGATLPVIGETWAVRLARGRQRVRWEHAARELWLEVRGGADPRQLLRRSLQEKALDHFCDRAQSYALRLGRPLPPLALSSAHSRWGSCSHRSGIRLNWRLIHLPPAQIDYVVAHELAHLIEMNHGARFWSQVERLLPDYQSARDVLKALAATVPRI